MRICCQGKVKARPDLLLWWCLVLWAGVQWCGMTLFLGQQQDNKIPSLLQHQHHPTNNNTGAMEIAFLAILSMQRSSSTSLLFDKLLRRYTAKCGIPLNEIFHPTPQQSGDAWLLYKKENVTTPQQVHQLPPSDLSEFLISVAQRNCQTKLNHTPKRRRNCQNRCIVGYKEFDFHLTYPQHAWLWHHLPNWTAVVLERSASDRWRSMEVAARTGDWTTNGSAAHRARVQTLKIPHMTHEFAATHERWYRFIQSHVAPEKRVEISFEESVHTKNESVLMEKVARALPPAFQAPFWVRGGWF